jgi:hypothetical protein
VRTSSHNTLFARQSFARRSVTGLALLLSLWMFAFASHIHTPDEQNAPHQGTQHCAFCLTLPGAAAAPTQISLPGTHAVYSRPVAIAAAFITSESFAFYQSRAPPAS